MVVVSNLTTGHKRHADGIIELGKKKLILFWRFETCLFGKDIIGEDSDAGGVGDEVSDRLHDVPWIDPPREPRQSATLHR